MATTNINSVVIQNEQAQTGAIEGLNRVIDGFNAASSNTIRLVNELVPGTSRSERFWDRPTSTIQHRDPTDTTTALTDIAMTQDSFIDVKTNKTWGPFRYTLDSLKKIGASNEEISFILGGVQGEDMGKQMIDSALISLESALENITALNYDASGATPTTTILTQGLRLFGDQAEKIAMWVMYSKSYWDLVGNAISAKIYEEAGRVVYGAQPGLLNRPVLVVDSPALFDTDSSGTTNDRYAILGLTADAAKITVSEPTSLVSDLISGVSNIQYRIQGEFAYNVGLKGMAWDLTNGGTNPTDATLGTGSYWLNKLSNVKSLGGVRIKVG